MCTGENKKKVALVIPSLGIGGTERQVYLLAKGLLKGRYRPVVCSLSGDGATAELLREAGVSVEILHKRHRIDPLLIFDLIKLFKQHAVQIAHSFLFEANSWSRVAARLSDVPIQIASERSIDNYKNRLHRSIDHQLFGDTPVIIANSVGVKSDLVRKAALPGRKVRIVYNGIDIAPFIPADSEVRRDIRRMLGLPVEGLLLGLVCRIHPDKDVIGLLRAFALALENCPDLNLVIVGGAQSRTEENYLVEVKKAIMGLELEKRIFLAGQKKDVLPYLSAMDIYVQSSVVEGFPNSVMEGMAQSLPVVATEAGGTPELVVNGQTGLLVPCRDVGLLASAIVRLAQSSHMRETMGSAGRRRICDNFSVETMVNNTEALYDKALKTAN